MNGSQVFDGKEGKKDADYIRWLDQYSSGFVVNLERSTTPRNIILHKANCGTIRVVRRSRGGIPKPGGFTERDYVKVCAETVSGTRDLLKRRLNSDQVEFLRRCQKCNPA